MDDFVLYNNKGYHNSGSKFAHLAILTEHNIPVTVQEAIDAQNLLTGSRPWKMN